MRTVLFNTVRMTDENSTLVTNFQHYAGKQLLAYLRGAAYAHAGEAEAIDLVMDRFEKNASREILDVGCGLGETAAYLQKHGWGRVTGIDIEPESIEYARQWFPEVEFSVCDVVYGSETIHKKFDVLCLFNVFYAFPDQKHALMTMSRLTRPKGRLIIFDYTTEIELKEKLRYSDGHEATFNPIDVNKIESWLSRTGWVLNEYRNLTTQYIGWYEVLLEKIMLRQTELIEKFGEASFLKAAGNYTRIKNALVSGELGGAAYYATLA